MSHRFRLLPLRKGLRADLTILNVLNKWRVGAGRLGVRNSLTKKLKRIIRPADPGSWIHVGRLRCACYRMAVLKHVGRGSACGGF